MISGRQQLHWSPAEKQAARRAYDKALRLEKEAAIREFKERVDRIRGVEDIGEMWDLQDWLRRRARDMDAIFDYRYSVLISVLAGLLFKGRITEADLEGLDAAKLEQIRSIVAMHRQWAERE